MNKLSLVLMLCIGHQVVSAQDMLPLIRADSKIVDVKEDGIRMSGIWNLSPETNPDVYAIMRSKKIKRVTFYTDMDSISFDVKAGMKYDFIILLNNKDSCYTQITTVNPPTMKHAAEHSTIAEDIIPFKLGKDNLIHINGNVNGSEILDLIFDTGAGSLVLTEKGLDKDVNLALDGTIENIGSGGRATQQTSSLNKLAISGMEWDSLSVTYIDYRGSLHADGVVGDNLFEDKIGQSHHSLYFNQWPLKMTFSSATYFQDVVKSAIFGDLTAHQIASD